MTEDLSTRIEAIRRDLRRAPAVVAHLQPNARHCLDALPPMAEAQVAMLEREYGISLPAEYRAFVTRVSEGGAGPAFGLTPLRSALELEGGGGRLALAFPHTEQYDPECDPVLDALLDRADRGEIDQEEADRVWEALDAGTLALCEEGCGYLHRLVVTGPARGQMWLDACCSTGGYIPLRVGFLEWYERWLADVLAGEWGSWWLGPTPPAWPGRPPSAESPGAAAGPGVAAEPK